MFVNAVIAEHFWSSGTPLVNISALSALQNGQISLVMYVYMHWALFSGTVLSVRIIKELKEPTLWHEDQNAVSALILAICTAA